MKDENKKLTELNAHQLGLITSEDLNDPIDDLDQNERKKYVALISSVYDVLKGELNQAIRKQVEHIAKTSQSWEQVLIGRGAINMGYVLLDRFQAFKDEHIENIKPEEEFDKHEII